MDLTPTNDTQSWAVTVERNGQSVVTLASNHLAGRDLSAEDTRVIRLAAEHLLAFIGASSAAECELCRGADNVSSKATICGDHYTKAVQGEASEATMHAAWRKRAEECERGTPVDPTRLEPFLKEMREVTIPAIVEAVYQRQRNAAIVYPPLREGK